MRRRKTPKLRKPQALTLAHSPNEDILYTGVYTSNQHILLTFDADPKNPAVAIVLRQYKKFRDLTCKQ